MNSVQHLKLFQALFSFTRLQFLCLFFDSFNQFQGQIDRTLSVHRSPTTRLIYDVAYGQQDIILPNRSQNDFSFPGGVI